MIRSLFWLANLLLGIAFAISAQAAPPQPDPVDSLLQRLEQSAPGMKTAVDLWQLMDLEGAVSAQTRQRILAVLTRLSTHPQTPLAVRRLAIRMRAERLRSAGQDAAADRAWRQLGPLKQWWLIGPLPPDSQRPDAPIRLDRQWPGKTGSVSWRALPMSSPDGRVLFHSLFRPRDHATAFALTTFALPRTMPVRIHLGCDDGCQLWVDDTLLLTDAGPHELAPDQHQLEVRLAKGSHRILVKVTQDSGAWGFVLGLSDRRGKAIAGIQEFSLAKDLNTALTKSMPKLASKTRSLPTLASWFQQQALKNPLPTHALAEAALALSRTHLGNARQKQVEHLLRRAAEHCHGNQAGDGETLLMLAKLSEDGNFADQLRQRASLIPATRTQAWSELGTAYQIRNQGLAALGAFAQALAMNPKHLPSQLGQAELFQSFGLHSWAESALEKILAGQPTVTDALLVAANHHRHQGHLRKAHALFSQLVRLQVDDRHALRALFDLAVLRGDLDNALSWLDRIMARSPWRTKIWLEKGDLLLHNGRSHEALAAYRRAREICPQEPSFLVREGLALQAMDRPDLSIERWTQALALSPQDQDLRRHLESLQQPVSAFYQAWVQDPQKLAQLAIPVNVDADAQRLADITVVRLHANGAASRYRQQILRVINHRGANRSRTFRIDYAPGRQQVRILRTRVWRAQDQIDERVLVSDEGISEPWYNLYYDIHRREITFPTLHSGDLIEFSYRLDDIGRQSIWDKAFGDLAPFQFAEPTHLVSYVLLAPPDLPLFFNMDPQQDRRADQSSYLWTRENIAGIVAEPDMPGFTESFSFLHLSTQTSWSQLAKWYADRLQDQIIASPEIKQLAARLVANLPREQDRIRAIYRYVSDQTRYVGLEFGIHSYIPYPVSQVLTRKFGDCKDKAALLVALFGEVGIRAHLALVRTRSFGDIAPAPASLEIFDHAVCVLPDHGLWLDATVAFHDITDLPAQDQDCPALVIGPDTTGLTQTPKSTTAKNLTDISLAIQSQPTGQAKVQVKMTVTGSLAPGMRNRLTGISTDKELFAQSLAQLFPTAEVESITVENLARPDLPLRLLADLLIDSLTRPASQGFELPALGRTTFYRNHLATWVHRQHDLALTPPWTVRWRVRHQPPKGYQLVESAARSAPQSPFGHARLRVDVQKNMVTVQAEFQVRKRRIAADAYPRFRQFLTDADLLFGQYLYFKGGKRAGS